MLTMQNNKIYGGIYKKGPSKKTDLFIMDPNMKVLENKLAPYYLWETIVHVMMMTKQGIVPNIDAQKILKHLLLLIPEAKKGTLVKGEVGDVHENIEKILTDSLGEDAGWLHIGRSRNDQAVVDQKLFTKKYLLDIFEELNKLESVLWKKTNIYKDTVMPGFTHLRVAMPSSFGFWWQSYLIQILNLHTALKSIFEIYDVCPLGAGASYGVNWPIDISYTAQNLGFSKPLDNALSAINNRGIDDANILAQLAILSTILSRMMEDLIIWSMPEIHYVDLGEEFTTGSSIMPQKKNPDIAEKIRSKSAAIIANLTHVLIAMKGTPSGYNRDSAESKVAMMDSLEQTLNTVSITGEMLSTVIPHPDEMIKGVIDSLPTKLADALVGKFHLPFRTAHKIVGSSVSSVLGELGKITPEVLEKTIMEITGQKLLIDKTFIDGIFNVKNALEQYQYKGSPGPKYVSSVNKELKMTIKSLHGWGTYQKKKFIKTEENIYKECRIMISYTHYGKHN